MSILPKFVLRYVAATAAYGFTRAVTYDYDGTQRYYNFNGAKYETKTMLVVDNVGRIVWKTGMAVFRWPFMLRRDAVRLECFACGKDLKEYGTLWDN